MAEQMTNKQKLMVYGILTVSGLAVAGPVLAYAASGAMNLIKLGVCIGVLFAGWMFTPYFKLKLKNMVIKSVMVEARKNPRETLQNEFSERSKAIELAKKRVVDMKAMSSSLSDKLERFKKKYSTSDEGMENMLAISKRLVESMSSVTKRAEKELAEFRQLIEQECDRYDMALSSGALALAIKNATGGQDPLRQFVQNEALDSIRDNFNHSMAEIDQLLESSEIPKLLSNDKEIDGEIDFTPINTEKILVGRN